MSSLSPGSRSELEGTAGGSRPSTDLVKTTIFFSVLAAVGLAGVFLHTGLVRSATPILWAMSCLASGGVAGFLFGIPKILQSDKPLADSATPYRQQVNTNLEQISDWLTKIIIGLGLIQIRNIPPYIRSLAETLAAALGPVEDQVAFALALIMYFSTIGFLFGYLSTRLFLAAAFYRADQEAMASFQRFQSVAAGLEADLVKQVVLKTPPEAFIKGEAMRVERSTELGQEAEDVDDDGERDEGGPAELEQTMQQLKKDKE